MKQLRFGIMGPGNIARKFAKACQLSQRVTVQGVASRSIDKAHAFAENYDIPCAYGDYDSLLQASDIDCVYIATTNQAHAALIKKAIMAKKPVLCEKPLTMSAVLTEECIALAHQQGVLLMEGIWTRCLPSIQAAITWVENGRIGKLLHMESSFSFVSEFNPSARLYDPAVGGGAILDLGAYCLALPRFFTQEPLTVLQGVCTHARNGVDDSHVVTMRFGKEITYQTTFGMRHRTDQSATIYGEQGKIVLEKFWCCTKATLLDAHDVQIDCVIDNAENGFVYEVDHFAELVTQGKTQSRILPHKLSEYVAQCMQALMVNA